MQEKKEIYSHLSFAFDGPFFPASRQHTCLPMSYTWHKTVSLLVAISVTSNSRLKTLNDEPIYKPSLLPATYD